MKKSLVVVGAGPAPGHLVSALVDGGAADRFSITLVSPEAHPPYERALFPGVVAGRWRAADLVSRPAQWYRRNGISLRMGCAAERVDAVRGEVHLSDGTLCHYDELVLASGSTPLRMAATPSGGGESTEVTQGQVTLPSFDMSCLDDVAALAERAASARRAVVVGGGATGIEVAWALAQRGISVHLAEASQQLMGAVADRCAADVIASRLARAGIVLHRGWWATGTGVDRTCGTAVVDVREGGASGVHRRIPCDLVVWACGSVPETGVAADAGLSVSTDGIVVDSQMRTSDPRVYAIGDCTTTSQALACSPVAEVEQAETLAAVLLGRRAEYSCHDIDIRLATPGLDVAVIGEPGLLPLPQGHAATAYVRNPLRGIYRAVTVEHGFLRRAVLVGDATSAPLVRSVKRSVMPLACEPIDLVSASSTADGPHGVLDQECERSSAAVTVTKQSANTATLPLVSSLEEASA